MDWLISYVICKPLIISLSFQNEPILYSLKEHLKDGRGSFVKSLKEATEKILREGKSTYIVL